MKKTIIFLVLSGLSAHIYADTNTNTNSNKSKCAQAEGERKFFSNIQSNIKEPTARMDFGGVSAKRDGLKCEGGWGKDGKPLPKETDKEKEERELKERKCSILERQYNEKKEEKSFVFRRILENIKETGCVIPEIQENEKKKEKEFPPEPIRLIKEEPKKEEQKEEPKKEEPIVKAIEEKPKLSASEMKKLKEIELKKIKEQNIETNAIKKIEEEKERIKKLEINTIKPLFGNQ